MPPKKPKSIPTAPYDMYIDGIRGIMKKNDVDLETAKTIALTEDTKNNGIEEHVSLIESAYKKLKEGQ